MQTSVFYTFPWTSENKYSPLKCFAPRRQILAKSAPQKARCRDKAKFATKLRKLSKDCVFVNNEE